MSQESLAKEYASICGQIKELEGRKEQIAITLLSHLEEMEASKMNLAYGTFTVGMRKSYTYSESVKEAEQMVKSLKKEEEKTQEPTIKKYLLFKSKE